jgi:hypothetical protein
VNISRDPARDRKALIALAVAVLGFLIFRLVPSGSGSAPKVVSQSSSLDDLELRLRRLRLSMARVPGKQAALKEAASQLAQREQHLIVADTVNQAQAQVLDAVKQLARKEGFEIRGTDFSAPKPFGEAYGEVAVSINAECAMEQLVNFMADLSNQSALLATSDLRVAAGNPKQKTINLRLTVSGLVPRKLVPEKKA